MKGTPGFVHNVRPLHLIRPRDRRVAPPFAASWIAGAPEPVPNNPRFPNMTLAVDKPVVRLKCNMHIGRCTSIT